MPKILFVGCGDIAARTAQNLSDDYEKYGLRRNVNKLPEGFIPVQADMADPASAEVLTGQRFDYVVVTFTPAGRDYQTAYVQASANLYAALLASPPKHIFYVSSTSVYGQNSGECVDETAATTAQGNGGLLRKSEDIWLSGGLPATVLRLSGIYGAERQFLLNQLKAGAGAEPGEHFTNRIHCDDAPAAIAHLIELRRAGGELYDIYNVSDDAPASQHELVEWVRAEFAVTPDPNKTLGRRAGSKRVTNKRLKASGFSYRYPSFKEGYSAN